MGLPRGSGWAAAYWGCAAAHWLGREIDSKAVRLVTKAALMPTLAAWARAQGCPRLLVGALLASAAGDSLMEQNLLLPAMAMYGGAHSCYASLFLRDHERLSAGVTAAYAGLGAGIVALLWPRLGMLRRPVALYAVALTATAATSRCHSRRAGAGGALFLISDALIGARLAGHNFPARDTLVGLTYTAAQFQLATGVVARGRAPVGGFLDGGAGTRLGELEDLEGTR